MQKYGLIGRSLKHSLSPSMHNLAFKEMDIPAVYQNIEIEPDNFDQMMVRLKIDDFSGFNITIPYKGNIVSFLDQIDPDAEAVGAVNTICVRKGKWHGFNTDIKGFLAPLSSSKSHFKNCLILGSGGAARAVIYALIRYLNVEKIVIGCRNPAKGKELNKHFSRFLKGISCEICRISEIGEIIRTSDLVINTTPVGMSPDVENSPVQFGFQAKKGAVFYDLIYNPPQTKFLAEAKRIGENILIINGMPMLLAQAALSFELWTGRKFPLRRVKDILFID
jgi:shikimate dehydrogenase